MGQTPPSDPTLVRVPPLGTRWPDTGTGTSTIHPPWNRHAPPLYQASGAYVSITPDFRHQPVLRALCRCGGEGVWSKEDHVEVTLQILTKIPRNLLLDSSPITLGRIKMFSKFIFLCLQNMVSGHQVEYINLPCPSHPQDLHISQDLKYLKR